MLKPPEVAVSAFDALFSVVELEVGSRCNRTCSYCPVSLNPRPPVPVSMPPAVFDALVGQLADVQFTGRISYHFYNEPLLRNDLDRLVAVIDRRLPEALQVLYTNGDRLDDAAFERLRAAGIDYFIVTRHSGGDFPDRSFQVVQRTEDLVLTNRGGAMTDLPTPTARHWREPCFAPSEMLIVTVTGDVVLCYEDARREHVLGNILDTHVAEIWRSPGFTAMRRQLVAGNRSRYDLCARCTNVAHARPGVSQVEEPFLNATDASATMRELKRLSVAARGWRVSTLEQCVAAVAGSAPVGAPVLLAGDENLVYRQQTAAGPVVVRLTGLGRRSRDEVAGELRWLIHLADCGVPVARPSTALPLGPWRLRGTQGVDGAEYLGAAFAFVDGSPPAAEEVDEPLLRRWGALLCAIHGASVGYVDVSRRRWRDTANYDVGRLALSAQDRLAVTAVLDIADAIGGHQLVHGDLGLRNVVRTPSGLVAIDFDDACHAPVGYDVAAALYDLVVDHGNEVALTPGVIARAFLDGYGSPAAPLRPLLAALVVERAIAARRLRAPSPAADDNLRRLLRSGRLPPALEDLATKDLP